jgi:hypothetical protein
MSAAAGVPGASEHFASGPFVLVKTFTPWYKCKRRPDRCRQFLRRLCPVLGALVLDWSITGENILSFLCKSWAFRNPLKLVGCVAEAV